MKWYWILAIGGIITYFVNKTASKYSWITGIITAALAFFAWKKG
jgi:uncharacterized membrane protein (UPF0136 family)